MLYTTATTVNIKKIVPVGSTIGITDDNRYSVVIRHKGEYSVIQAGDAGDVTTLAPNTETNTPGYIQFNNIAVKEGVSSLTLYQDELVDVDVAGARTAGSKVTLCITSVMSVTSTVSTVEV